MLLKKSISCGPSLKTGWFPLSSDSTKQITVCKTEGDMQDTWSYLSNFQGLWADFCFPIISTHLGGSYPAMMMSSHLNHHETERKSNLYCIQEPQGVFDLSSWYPWPPPPPPHPHPQQRWRTGKVVTNNQGNNNHSFYSNCTFITELQKHLAQQATIPDKERQQQVESEVQGGGGDGE